MWAAGWWASCGISPAEIMKWSGEDMVVYTALAELIREQKQEDMTAAVLDAFLMILNALKKK